ncbi:hypothetical protein BSG1_08356 [Bacillus sp. SG-1]|nr:hypothetical protein BSG1_08356 [Bacillus sp. SG-1]
MLKNIYRSKVCKKFNVEESLIKIRIFEIIGRLKPKGFVRG